VVSSKEEEVLGVFDFVAQQKQNRFKTLLATVNIVTQEQIVGLWWETAHLEKTNKVRVLPMDVADNLDRRTKFDKGGLRKEDFAGSLTDGGNLVILETNGLIDFGRIPNLEQTVDHVVDVYCAELLWVGPGARG
jgi:hypothetical protein